MKCVWKNCSNDLIQPKHGLIGRFCSKYCYDCQYRENNRDRLKIAKKNYYNSDEDRKIRIKQSVRKSRLKQTFNITPDDYDKMLIEQNGKCYLCDRSQFDNYGKSL